MNEIINVREAAIRLLTGARSGDVLNAAPHPGGAPPGPEIAAELRLAVNQFQAEAFAAGGTRIDYQALRASEAYRRYREELTPRLRQLDLARLRTREERLAFWINLYNALVIDAVIRFEVRRSVREHMAGLAFFRWAAYDVGGERFSCEDIENGVLRANAGNPFIYGAQLPAGDGRLRWVLSPVEPLIHFGINCASRSCPPIGVYAADRIVEQLEASSRSFVGTDTEVDARRGALRISSIYSWYKSDFGGDAGVLRFIRDRLPAGDERQAWIASRRELDLEFKPYDWSLNA
jgi:hypothetical protein